MSDDIRSAFLRVFPFALVLLILYFLFRKKKLDPYELDLRRPRSVQQYFGWTAGFLIFILAEEFIFFRAGLLEVDRWNHGLLSSLIRIPGAVVLAPVAEEFLFRGLILNALVKRNVNPHLAIFIQACFFLVCHQPVYENTFSSYSGIFQCLLDATLFGYARRYTGSIYTPITMHMTGNAIAVGERFIF
jgi:membrane protease YdiL (CAAX protease family)